MTPTDASGVLGYSMILLGARTRAGNKTKILISLAFFLNAIFFFGKGMPTSSAVNIITGIRTLSSIKSKNKLYGILFMIAIAGSYLVFQSEIIAAVAGVVGTFGFYWFDSIRCRYFMTATAAMRMSNFFNYEMYGPFLAELVNTILLSLSIRKLHKRSAG